MIYINILLLNTQYPVSYTHLDNSIFAICRTATGDIYLGTMFGLVKYNKQSDDFDRIPELNGKFVYDLSLIHISLLATEKAVVAVDARIKIEK